MYRAPKVANRVLDQRIKEKNYESHQSRMRQVKSVVDVSCPLNFKRSQSSFRHSKKEALQEQRYIQIERENRILLQKMTSIMTKEPSKYQQSGLKSLNRERRKKDLVKITLENQAIMNRIISQRAQYSKQKWEEQRHREEYMLQGMCQYPYQLGNTGSLFLKTSSKHIKPLHYSNNLNEESANQPEEQLLPERVIVYKKTKQLLNDTYFLVEICKTQNIMHFTAHDVQNGKAYILEIPIQQAQRILAECNQQYDSMAEKLRIVNGHLILKDKNQQKDNLAQNNNKKEVQQSQKSQQQVIQKQKINQNDEQAKDSENDYEEDFDGEQDQDQIVINNEKNIKMESVRQEQNETSYQKQQKMTKNQENQQDSGVNKNDLIIMDDGDLSINVIRLCKLNNIEYTLKKSQNFGIKLNNFKLDQCEAALIYLCQVLDMQRNLYPKNILYRAEIDKFFSWSQSLLQNLGNKEKLQANLKSFDTTLKANNLYVTNKQKITIGDLYAFYLIEKIGNISNYKSIEAWYSNMKKEIL